LCFVMLLVGSFSSLAQEKYTISGTITDARNGETMIGTNVFVEPIMKGSTSNVYGFYSLTVPEGDYTLKVSFLGYETFAKEIKLDKNLTFNLELAESAFTKDEVVVKGEKKDENTKSSKMTLLR
jgi:hypothetical protein